MEIKKFYLYNDCLLYLTGYDHRYIFEVINSIHLSDEIIKDLKLRKLATPGVFVTSNIDSSNMLFKEYYLGYEGFEKQVKYIKKEYQIKLKKYFSNKYLHIMKDKIKEELI